MYAFVPMLVPLAKNAGIKVPEDVDNYNPDEFPHWHVFLLAQICQPLPYPSAGWDNAKVIASIEESKLKKMTFSDFVDAGLAVGSSYAYT